MGIEQVQETEGISRLIDAAMRLRAVREAQRRFIALWEIEQELSRSRRASQFDERFRGEPDGSND